MSLKEPRNAVVVSVYLDLDQHQFVSDLAKCEGKSKTRQIEKMLLDWRKNWEEKQGEGAVQTMRNFVQEMEERGKRQFALE